MTHTHCGPARVYGQAFRLLLMSSASDLTAYFLRFKFFFNIILSTSVKCIQGDSGVICTTLGNNSMSDSKQKKFI